MVRFEHPQYWWLAPIATLLIVVGWAWRWYGKRGVLGVPRGAGFRPLWWGGVARWVAIAWLLAAAWANPQVGQQRVDGTVPAVDLLVVLDVSRSMTAQDVSPSRLERARLFVSGLLRRLTGQRVGLVVFAQEAYLQMPFTNDYAAAALFVGSASAGMLSAQGSDISAAIERAQHSFDSTSLAKRVVLLLSDGEEHNSGAAQAARAAARAGVAIFAVGVGTVQGGHHS